MTTSKKYFIQKALFFNHAIILSLGQTDIVHDLLLWLFQFYFNSENKPFCDAVSSLARLRNCRLPWRISKTVFNTFESQRNLLFLLFLEYSLSTSAIILGKVASLTLKTEKKIQWYQKLK